MTTRSLRRLFVTLALAVLPVAGAGVASAQGPTCVALDHGAPAKPLLQLAPTPAGNGFVSIVGRRTHPIGGDRGVVSGGGVTINGIFEITLQSTTIATVQLFGPGPVLISGSTHILLNPATLSGPFKTVEIVTSEGGALHIEHTEGTASVVPCP
jgi:hypothetical protein